MLHQVLVQALPRLPRRLRVLVARHLLGWEIHPTARLGRSLIDVRNVRMGPGSSIGPRNSFRGLDELVLEAGAAIGGDNRVIGFRGRSPFPPRIARRSALVLGEFARITTGHDIDCSDTVVLEHHAVLGGFGCTVLTHSLNLRTNGYRVAPLRIGHHAIVMSGCTIFVGANIADKVAVSASSVVAEPLEQPSHLYRGNPATVVRELDDSYEVLVREGDYGVGRPGEDGADGSGGDRNVS